MPYGIMKMVAYCHRKNHAFSDAYLFYKDVERGREMRENKWLSMKEVCEYLRISRDTVINWINKEGMPAHKKGRLWRFDVNEVDEWMKNGHHA